MHQYDPYGEDDLYPTADDFAFDDRARKKQRQERRTSERPATPRKRIRPPRTERDQAFKCRHCKQFIGAPIAGGRHRNHCPNCLYSRHVDNTMPGDRKSDCHALMRPLGVIARRNGEQVIIHECLGCGKHDPNRIAADDNPSLVMRLQPLAPPGLDIVPEPGAVPAPDAETA